MMTMPFIPLLVLLLRIPLSWAVKALYSSTFSGPSPLWYEPGMVEHAMTLIRSHQVLTGRPLLPDMRDDCSPEEAARALFFAGHVVLSHGTQMESQGPILNYGNNAGLRLWKATWEELTTMPSKHTAEVEDQEARAVTMETVSRFGFVEGYSGVRVAMDGSRFRIEDVTIWNVVEEGRLIGQAAAFPRWTSLS